MFRLFKFSLLVICTTIIVFKASAPANCRQTESQVAQKIIVCRHGNIKCTFVMKLDHADYNSYTSQYCWGLYPHEPNYRCELLTVTVGKDKIGILESVYSALSNIDTVSISHSVKKKTFAIHIAGGDAASGFYGTINFKYITDKGLVDDYEPISRIIRNGEFPDTSYESSIYHPW